MENSFDHARAFLVKFFQNHPTGLDNNSAVKLMTDYAAHFITGEVVDTVSDAVSNLEAKFKAKVEELEQTIQNLTQAHQEQINALQPVFGESDGQVHSEGLETKDPEPNAEGQISENIVEEIKPAKKGKGK